MPSEPVGDIASFKRVLKEGYARFASSHRLIITKSRETGNHFHTHTPEARRVKPSVSDYTTYTVDGQIKCPSYNMLVWGGENSDTGAEEMTPVLPSGTTVPTMVTVPQVPAVPVVSDPSGGEIPPLHATPDHGRTGRPNRQRARVANPMNLEPRQDMTSSVEAAHTTAP